MPNIWGSSVCMLGLQGTLHNVKCNFHQPVAVQRHNDLLTALYNGIGGYDLP